LSARLGIPFYDKKLLSIAAIETGLDEKYIEQRENRPVSMIFDMYTHSRTFAVEDHAYLAEVSAIRQAAESSCVIVGRCSDYVLREMKNCLHVFVYAPKDERIRRVVEQYRDAEPEKAEDYLHKIDKIRASRYGYLTGRKWGDARNYDICVNSSIGIDAAVDAVAAAYERVSGRKS
ncbi:MAG: cytidylate kinase-like family protein, partial [Clostridia bacterium]|nr:cytidylate kinase-like family protein [Clostridia bacterium]